LGLIGRHTFRICFHITSTLAMITELFDPFAIPSHTEL
jgi:hypothetical protein